MRGLSSRFLDSLQNGHLAPLTRVVRQDKDLDLAIRKDYLNIYFKGNSLLKLEEHASGYRPHVDPKFLDGAILAPLDDETSAERFVDMIPSIKSRIIRVCGSSLETEYEQLVIRANNREPRSASEYFIVDRQYATGAGERFDLIACCWPRAGRRSGQTVSPCVLEVKFALNNDIGEVDAQLARYYAAIAPRAAEFAEECETVFRQKLALGLYDQPPYRLAAMKTLRFAREIEHFQFALVLVDYNPHSALFDESRLKALPFARQVRLFRMGFAMWQHDSASLAGSPN
jgi:hypothetical protein